MYFFKVLERFSAVKWWSIIANFMTEKYLFLLENLNIDLLTLQTLVHINDVFHRLLKRNMFVLALDNSSHSRSTPHVGSTVKKQGERLFSLREIKMLFLKPLWQVLCTVSRGILRKNISLMVAASWMPPNHCDPTVADYKGNKQGSENTIMVRRSQKGSQSSQKS